MATIIKTNNVGQPLTFVCISPNIRELTVFLETLFQNSHIKILKSDFTYKMFVEIQESLQKDLLVFL